ncbi:uncharacterized protein LTR77_007755 [Saxophila tyrrhenica]|uniref:GH16 domain-containing protein n=1 Tax=Saxophila tyrrhenica TaxID=1690608 RepID=A0AAV9P3F5_9PEZI|nr:hypothetical protein LTR77_007755 [Saxophila tyrrhenica]
MRSFHAITTFAGVASAQYQLQSTFAGETFFENFNFWNSWDPTYGFVQYVSQEAAQGFGMINVTNTSATWGVDTTQIFDPTSPLGRPSIRITTLESWTHGLFIADLAHVPANQCGTWPAFWALGSGMWPESGEIDIIEYTNNVPNNLMALHTTPGCSIAGAGQTGTLISADCGIEGGITGCTVVQTSANNSGDSFNANGGGVYAMEWTSRAIRVWFFPREAIPASIVAGTPVVEDFGLPAANFQGSCALDQHFYNMSLVFNIDFCGQYAGNVWQANGCPMLDPDDAIQGWASCNMFVASSPQSFVNSYWEVNYLKVFQTTTFATPRPTTSLSSGTPAISTGSGTTALSNAQGRSSTATMSLAPVVPSIAPASSTTLSLAPSVRSSLSSRRNSPNASPESLVPTLATTPPTTASQSIASPTIATPTTGFSTTATPAAPEPIASPPTPTAEATTASSPLTIPTTPLSTTEGTTASISCSGNLCVSYAYTSVVVVQTVTVGAEQLALD